jgi:hypothetical protein
MDVNVVILLHSYLRCRQHNLSMKTACTGVKMNASADLLL